MRIRESPYLLRVFLAFLLATVLFVLIFLFAYSVSYLNYKGVVAENAFIQDSLAKIDKAINNSTLCTATGLFEASERLDAVGSRVGLLETRLGSTNSEVIVQKKKYSELEYKHFILVRTLARSCKQDVVTLLFFYSNDEVYQKESERMGIILSTFKNADPQRIFVYSFDAQLNLSLIRDLRERYSVMSVPVVIVNESAKAYPRTLDEFERFV